MKLITSIYQLNHRPWNINYRVLNVHYIEPLQRLIKPDWVKIICYTDEYTDNMWNLRERFKGQNIEFRFFDISKSEYVPKVWNLRKDFDFEQFQGERMVAVDHYAELTLEKFRMVEENITDGETILWFDAGLLQNGCSTFWCEWVYQFCSENPFFLEKLNEYTQNDFFCMYADGMNIHRDVIKTVTNPKIQETFLIAGGLWGGNPEKTKVLIQSFKESANVLLDHGIICSEQEAMGREYMIDPSRFTKPTHFLNWNDLQKIFLQIMNMVPENYDIYTNPYKT